jgi:hypothetical protein
MATVVSKFRLRFDSDAGRPVQLFRAEGSPRMSSRRKGRSPVSPSLGLVLFLALAGLSASASPSGQRDQPPPMSATTSSQGNTTTMHGAQDPDPLAHRVEERMAERRNEERQKALVADTDRLLALAQQLKVEVDKSNKDMLSVEVVRRAEQIEKLAHSVKEKMRGN